MDFATVLKQINTGAQIAAAIAPAIETWGNDHVAATQDILATAAAGVAAESSDPQIGQEAALAAELAINLTPLAFKLFSLFRHKPAPPATAATA